MDFSNQPSNAPGIGQPGSVRVGTLWSQARLALSLTRLTPFDTDTPHGRSQERYRRIALTTLSSLMVRGVGTLVGLVMVPLVLGYLGKERYGLWSTITTVVAWVALFDLGIANGLVNAVARAHGRDDKEEAARYVTTALAMLLTVAAVLGAAMVVTVPRLSWSSLLAVRAAADEATVRGAVTAALTVFVVNMPLSVVPQIYAAYQRAYVANAFSALGTILGFGAIVAAVRGGATMPLLVATFGAGATTSSVLGFVYALGWGMPWLRPRPSALSGEALKGILRRSVPIFLFQAGALAVNETQAIILAHRCDLATVADYSVLMRVYVLLIGLIQTSTASFVPSFREAAERGDHAWLHVSFAHFVRVRVLLAAGAAAFLLAFGNVLLRVWLHRSDVAFRPLVWLVLGVTMIATMRVTAHSDLIGILDRLWVLVLLALLNGAVTVGLTYWLAGTLGVAGAVVASGAVTILVYVWLLPVVSRRVLSSAPVLTRP